MVRVPDSKKNFADTCITVTEYRRVTDGRTDGHLVTALSALCIRVAR